MHCYLHQLAHGCMHHLAHDPAHGSTPSPTTRYTRPLGKYAKVYESSGTPRLAAQDSTICLFAPLTQLYKSCRYHSSPSQSSSMYRLFPPPKFDVRKELELMESEVQDKRKQKTIWIEKSLTKRGLAKNQRMMT